MPFLHDKIRCDYKDDVSTGAAHQGFGSHTKIFSLLRHFCRKYVEKLGPQISGATCFVTLYAYLAHRALNAGTAAVQTLLTLTVDGGLLLTVETQLAFRSSLSSFP